MPSSVSYDSLTKDLGSGAVKLEIDLLRVLLVNGYTPAPATHARRSDVIASEVTGTGYAAGGATLASIVGTLDATNHRTRYTATNPSWATSTITATGAVVYKSRGGASSADELVSYIDFGGSVSSTAAAFTITSFASSGFLDINRS